MRVFVAALFLMAGFAFAEGNGKANVDEIFQKAEKILPEIKQLQTTLESGVMGKIEECASALTALNGHNQVLEAHMGLMWFTFNLGALITLVLFFLNERRLRRDLAWWMEKAQAERSVNLLAGAKPPKKGFLFAYCVIAGLTFAAFNLFALYL